MARSVAKSTAGEPGVVGKGAHVRGRISGRGDLRVEGVVEGDLAIDGELTVADGAQVTADVEAGSVAIEGVVEGDVQASDAIAIRAGARVVGTLRAGRLSIEEGAAYAGRIEADFELPAELGGKAGR
jgi:cytoskeletal protein CcmA (bactofilin family)